MSGAHALPRLFLHADPTRKEGIFFTFPDNTAKFLEVPEDHQTLAKGETDDWCMTVAYDEITLARKSDNRTWSTRIGLVRDQLAKRGLWVYEFAD